MCEVEVREEGGSWIGSRRYEVSFGKQGRLLMTRRGELVFFSRGARKVACGVDLQAERRKRIHRVCERVGFLPSRTALKTAEAIEPYRDCIAHTCSR